MGNCTVERDSCKSRNQRVAAFPLKLRRYYPKTYTCVRPLYPSIECFRGKFGEINICDSLVTNGKYPKTS